MTNNERAFIVELEQLSRKYNVYITGCGCCGSPSVDESSDPMAGLEAGYIYEGHLEWVEPEQFGWDHADYMYKDKVIK